MINLNAFSIQLKSDKKRTIFRRLARLIADTKDVNELVEEVSYFFGKKENWLLIDDIIFNDFIVALKNTKPQGGEGILLAFTNNAFNTHVKHDIEGLSLSLSFVSHPALDWLPILVERMNELNVASKEINLSTFVLAECVIANTFVRPLSAEELLAKHKEYANEINLGRTLIPFETYLRKAVKNQRTNHLH